MRSSAGPDPRHIGAGSDPLLVARPARTSLASTASVQLYTQHAVEFEWNQANRSHVRQHLVEPAEAEDALLDRARVGARAYRVRGEQRWFSLGATEDGRVLFVVFTRRRSKIRIITARDATPREKRRYRSSRK